MNPMNLLETQLRSWAPRRPSARLEQRLFAVAPSQPRPAHAFGWLAPAMACFLLALAVAGQRNAATVASGAHRDALVAVIMSNQSYAAYLPGNFQHGQNRLPTDTF